MRFPDPISDLCVPLCPYIPTLCMLSLGRCWCTWGTLVTAAARAFAAFASRATSLPSFVFLLFHSLSLPPLFFPRLKFLLCFCLHDTLHHPLPFDPLLPFTCIERLSTLVAIFFLTFSVVFLFFFGPVHLHCITNKTMG